MKTKMKNNKGITLIALIITIIIMLILVAVTINVVVNSGIIVSAKIAAQKTENAYEEEAQVESKIKVGEENLIDYLNNLNKPKEKMISFKINNVTYEAKEETKIVDFLNSKEEFIQPEICRFCGKGSPECGTWYNTYCGQDELGYLFFVTRSSSGPCNLFLGDSDQSVWICREGAYDLQDGGVYTIYAACND